MRGVALLAICVSCTHPATPPHVSIAPPAASPPRPLPTAATPRAPAPSLFDFRHGTLMEAFHDYAISYWGANGASAVAWKGDVAAIGRYAAVAAKDGLWARDFGDRGWVTEIARDGDHVVCRYTIRDEDGGEDGKRWQQLPRGLPGITSVTHMVVEVWTFESPRVLFAHEYEAWANCCGSEIGPAPPRISDEITITHDEVRVRFHDAWRASRATFHETPLVGVEPVIAPWDADRDVTFRITR
ncbi:MAG TPA: hypothetical protein VGH28_29130 [Polyangiaceae bacterium]